MKKHIITIAALLGITMGSHAQQAITYSQYGQVQSMLNPAATLMRPEGEVSFIGRRQWVGFEGAPSALWGNAHFGIQSIRSTMGINIRHESMAVERNTEASVFFANAVRISEREYLGLSLNAGVAFHNGQFSGLDPQDPAFRDDVRDADVLTGFGIMLYRPDRYYVGLSLPRLMLSNLGVARDRQYDFRNQYHLLAGALFALGTDFAVRPSLLVTYAENLRPQAEVQAMVFAKEIFGLGLNFRSYGEIAGMMQLNFSRIAFGYSYQFNPGSQALNRRIENTTHEIGISYRFGNKPVGLL